MLRKYTVLRFIVKSVSYIKLTFIMLVVSGMTSMLINNDMLGKEPSTFHDFANPHYEALVEAREFRLGLNFAGEKISSSRIAEKVAKEIPKNISRDEHGKAMIQRAFEWKPEMLAILDQYSIPEDFFYLMVAESGVKNATSHAGAKGFWQFMPRTAREYGLRVDKFIDERLDPIKSTHAAARYLQDAFERLGDWTLVAASYNMGMSGVEKAVKKQRKRNYFDLKLNRETGRYVYRILALKTVLRNPAKYGFDVQKDYLASK